MDYRTIQSSPRSRRRLRTSLFIIFVLTMLLSIGGGIYIVTKTPASAIAVDEPREVTALETPQPLHTLEAHTKQQETPASPQPIAAAKPAVQQAPPVAAPVARTDRLIITAIGLTSPIVPVGKTPDNAIDVHPSLVGWYDRSAAFGTPGAAFLDGHNPGVFRNLPALGIGTPITVERASGEILQYTVVYTETVPLEGIDMRKALRPYNGAPEGLNLMTCVGTYNPQTGTTDQRFIVYAVRS